MYPDPIHFPSLCICPAFLQPFYQNKKKKLREKKKNLITEAVM